MSRRTILWSLACVAGAAALYGAVELRERQDAERLRGEAEHLLSLPLERAPTLATLPAARAVMLLDDALALDDGDRTRALRQLAYALSNYQKGKPERAREALSRAGRAGRAWELAALLEAELALDAGEHAKVRALLEGPLAGKPPSARAQLLRAELALATDDTAGAKRVLDGMLQAHPEVATLHDRRAVAAESLGQLTEAREGYARAAALDGSDPSPAVNLGRLLRQAGELQEAEQAFERALRLSAALPGAWLGRGLCRLEQGDVEGARLDLEQARTLAPAEPGPLLALGDVHVARGEAAEAVPLYRAAVALEDDAVAWLKLGNALIRTGALQEARQALEQSIELNPELAAAHNGLGAALGALGEGEAAEAALRRAATLDANDPNPLLNLARLRSRRGDRTGAAEALAEAKERAPHLALR